MKKNSREEQLILSDFVKLLHSLPDDRSGVNQTMDFLNSILKIRSLIPPTAEIVTVLKNKKPILFQFLKKSVAPSSQLFFVVQLDMDYNVACERLQLDKEDPNF